MQKYFKWISHRRKTQVMSVVKYASQREREAGRGLPPQLNGMPLSIKTRLCLKSVFPRALKVYLNGNNYKYTLFFH